MGGLVSESESFAPSGDKEPVSPASSAVPAWGTATSTQVLGTAPSAWAPPPKKRPVGIAVIAIVVVAAISGAIYLVSAGNQSSDDSNLGNTLTLPTVDIPSAAAYTPPPAPVPTSETATCVASLSACLMPVPTGSSAWHGSWGAETAPTPAEYADEFEPNSAWRTRIVAQLGESGLTSISQHSWITSSGDQVQDVLLGFGTDNGAQSWFDTKVDGLTGTEFFIPGQATAQGWTLTGKTSGGYTQSVVYGSSGSTVMALWVLRDGAADQASATQWAATQLQLVAAQSSVRALAAPTTTAPPAYAAGSTSSSACANGSIDSCLMAAPAGSLPLPGEEAYDTTTNVTVQQFVAEHWVKSDADDQATQVNLLQTAGVTQIAHRSWDDADASQADVSVLEFSTAADASGYATSFESEAPQGSTEFPIAGLSSAQGDVQPMGTNGFVQIQIVDPEGQYLLVLTYWSPATANTAEAAQIFGEDFDLLP